MNINEFANLHNQHHRTVSIYIKRHPELFDGHIEDFENQKILDDEAIRILKNNIHCLNLYLWLKILKLSKNI